MHFGSAIMGIFLANRDAPSRCTATDCLVLLLIYKKYFRKYKNVSNDRITKLHTYLAGT